MISAAVSIKTTKAEGSVGASFQNAEGKKLTGDQCEQEHEVDGQRRGLDQPGSAELARHRQTAEPVGRHRPFEPDFDRRVASGRPSQSGEDRVAEGADAAGDLGVSGYAGAGPFRHGEASPIRSRGAVGAGRAGRMPRCRGTRLRHLQTPELGRGDAAGGRASFLRDRGGDIWIDTSSVCLPVPAGHHYTAAAPDTWARCKAPARFAIAETNLTLGNWQLVEMSQGFINSRPFKAETDGFVFCSLEARNDGDRGFATCAVDNTSSRRPRCITIITMVVGYSTPVFVRHMRREALSRSQVTLTLVNCCTFPSGGYRAPRRPGSSLNLSRSN